MLPQLFKSSISEQTLMQCGRYEETAQQKGTLFDLDCEWLDLNNLGWNVTITFANVLVWVLTQCPLDSRLSCPLLATTYCREPPCSMQTHAVKIIFFHHKSYQNLIRAAIFGPPYPGGELYSWYAAVIILPSISGEAGRVLSLTCLTSKRCLAI